MVMVVWIDAGLKTGWQNQNEALDWAGNDEEFIVIECGFVFDETEEYLLLVSGFSTSNVMNPTRINQNTIKEVIELTEVPSAEEA
jgi:hypothetical protein